MKQFVALILSAVLLLALTACGGVPSSSSDGSSDSPLTEADVLSAYDTAAEVYDWFDLCAPPTAGDAVLRDGGRYYTVHVDGLSTYANLEARVHASFSDSLAEAILAGDETCSVAPFRDIDGRLCTLAGARGENIYLLGKTVRAEPVDDTHWTVTLTFYGDSYEFDSPSATVGYTRRVLDYEKTADGWRFTNFCPTDDFDPDCDTAFTFTYGDPDDYLLAGQSPDDCGNLQLACWLLHSDGLSEGASDTLSHRFLSDPDGWFDALSAFAGRPWENAQSVMEAPAYNTYAWFTVEEQTRFENILASYQPKTDAEQSLLDTLCSAADRARAWAVENETAAFALLSGDQAVCLGPQDGAYPWGHTGFPASPDDAGTGDNGERGFSFSGADVTVDYFVNPDDESSYVNRISTVSPRPALPRGVDLGVGCTERQVLDAYPEAREYGALQPVQGADFDTVYVYEPGGLAGCKHIVFFLKDGAITEIDMEDLLDGQLLEH